MFWLTATDVIPSQDVLSGWLLDEAHKGAKRSNFWAISAQVLHQNSEKQQVDSYPGQIDGRITHETQFKGEPVYKF